jgi:hypothetical protein
MIYILWCTIRPKQFIKFHEEWIKKAKNPSNIVTKVAVNWEQHKSELSNYPVEVEVVQTNRIGVCYPSYQLSSKLECENDSDIVVFASDDFLPPDNWDLYLEKKFEGVDGCLFVPDGYQLEDSSNMIDPCITIPLMTYGCLKKLNKTIYHPAYNHMFSDNELHLNCKELGMLINGYHDGIQFLHVHHSAGLRGVDEADRHYHAKWQEDKERWNMRKNLPLGERLKVEI